MFEKEENELKEILESKPISKNENKESIFDRLNLDKKTIPKKKHFYDCKLTNEDWGVEDCLCPGTYIYRKYLSVGLTKEEAKLISNYCDFGDAMEEQERIQAEKLYEKYKFLKINSPKQQTKTPSKANKNSHHWYTFYSPIPLSTRVRYILYREVGKTTHFSF